MHVNLNAYIIVINFDRMGCQNSKSGHDAIQALTTQGTEAGKINASSDNTPKKKKKQNSRRFVPVKDPGLWNMSELSNEVASLSASTSIDQAKAVSLEDVIRRRQIFWDARRNEAGIGEIDTRQRQACWISIQNTCEALLDGDIDSANTLLRKEGIYPVDGDMATCMDEHSDAPYKVPRYCFCRPKKLSGLTSANTSLPPTDHGKVQLTVDLNGSTGYSCDVFHVLVRLSHIAKDTIIQLDKSSTILDLKRKIHFELTAPCEATQPNTPGFDDIAPIRQRIFLNGREQENSKKIATFPGDFFSFTPIEKESPNKRAQTKPIQVFIIPKSDYDRKRQAQNPSVKRGNFQKS